MAAALVDGVLMPVPGWLAFARPIRAHGLPATPQDAPSVLLFTADSDTHGAVAGDVAVWFPAPAGILRRMACRIPALHPHYGSPRYTVLRCVAVLLR